MCFVPLKETKQRIPRTKVIKMLLDTDLSTQNEIILNKISNFAINWVSHNERNPNVQFHNGVDVL